MKTILKLSLFLLAIACSNACTSEIDDTNSVDDMNSHTCTMLLAGGRMEFDSGINESRAVGSNWSNGDVLYIVFTRANGTTTYGTATFRASNGTWDVTYNESLARDKSTTCKVYYFEGKEDLTSEIIALDPTDAVYADETAKYSFPSGGVLTVTATLKPLTSRIRFKGNSGMQLTICGISNYKSYSKSSGLQPLSKNSAITIAVNSNGYTPYLYGVFESQTSPGISVAYNNYSYTADCSNTSILQVGKSGWMNVPTISSHNGWIENANGGSIGGHEYVDLGLPSGTLWATCNIGASTPEEYGDYFAWGETVRKTQYSWDNYKYYHQATNSLTKYCDNTNNSYNGIPDYKTILDLSDDAAYVNWGTMWCMPSKEQIDELIDNCSNTKDELNGYGGVTFIGSNGFRIFFPYAGVYEGGGGDVCVYPGSIFGYWSSTYANPWHAYELCDYDNNRVVVTNMRHRSLGLTIRPVIRR